MMDGRKRKLSAVVVSLLLILSTGAGVVLTATGTASAQPTEIRSCAPNNPIDAPGVYVVTRNLRVADGEVDCLVVTADDVVIDGDGHEMRGSKLGLPGNFVPIDAAGVGIRVEGASNVTVKNFGEIEIFDVGVLYRDSTGGKVLNNVFLITDSGVVIEDTDPADGVRHGGTEVAENRYWGGQILDEVDERAVVVDGADGNVVHDNGVVSPFHGIIVNSGAENRVENNTVEAFEAFGVWVQNAPRTTVRNNSVAFLERKKRNQGVGTGIMVVGGRSTDTRVEDNRLNTFAANGISLSVTEGVTAVNNRINNTTTGIQLVSANGSEVSENTVSDPLSGDDTTGISFAGGRSSRNTVAGNAVTGPSVGLAARNVRGVANVVSENRIEADDIGVSLNNARGFTVSGNPRIQGEAFGIEIRDSAAVVRDNPAIWSEGVGVDVLTNETIGETRVEDNIVSGASVGISLSRGDESSAVRVTEGVELDDNYVVSTGVAIFLDAADGNELRGNVIVDTDIGINVLRSSDGNRLIRNGISDAERTGIRVEGSERTELAQNFVNVRDGTGIQIGTGTEFTLLRDNDVRGPTVGTARIGTGVLLVDADDTTLRNNTFSRLERGVVVFGATPGRPRFLQNTFRNDQFGLDVLTGAIDVRGDNRFEGNNVGLRLSRSSARVDDAGFEGNTAGVVIQSPPVGDDVPAVTIDDSRFVDNVFGVDVREVAAAATVEIRDTRFVGNDAFGVFNQDRTDPEDVVDAEGNFWGAGNGPSSTEDPDAPFEDPFVPGSFADGDGDAVSEGATPGVSNVHFTPFLGEFASVRFAPGEDVVQSDGRAVTVPGAFLSAGGFLAVHDGRLLDGERTEIGDDDLIDTFLGVSPYLAPGDSEDVTVRLDEPLSGNATVVVVPYRDVDGDEAFGFVQTQGETDGPFLASDGAPVADGGVVFVGERARFEITGFDFPASVSRSEIVAGTVRVTNTGEAPGTGVVGVRIDGDDALDDAPVFREETTLDPNETVTLEFRVPTDFVPLGNSTVVVFTDDDERTTTVSVRAATATESESAG